MDSNNGKILSISQPYSIIVYILHYKGAIMLLELSNYRPATRGANAAEQFSQAKIGRNIRFPGKKILGFSHINSDVFGHLPTLSPPLLKICVFF
jgi:hypothetical protein